MNLPPTIQVLSERWTVFTDERVQAIAHEACRLQREACADAVDDYDWGAYDIRQTPLVIPEVT